MRLDPAIVQQQINNLLLQFSELADDDVLRADMIEGQTDANEFLTMIVRLIDDARALSDGTDARLKELQARQARFDRRVVACRALALKIMTTADLKKVELPEATLSVRNVPPKVIGEPDPNILPDNLVITARSPNRVAIKKALEAGEQVNGCQLSNGDIALTIRVK